MNNNTGRFRGPHQLRPKFQNVVFGALTGTRRCDGLDTRQVKNVAILRMTQDRLLRRKLSGM